MTRVEGTRKDIQGLRAVAVIVVVCFHASLALPGGFVGVDVFFVVSGFVIAQMLAREVASTGTISLRRFYSRRARRLLPALAAMTLVTLPIMVLLTSPFDAQVWSGRTAAAAASFVSNAYLWWSGGDYFGPTEDRNLFLHTWSLSVEEQFYFAVPAVLLACVATAKRRGSPMTWLARAAATIGVLSAISLLLSMVLLSPALAPTLSPGKPAGLAFYSLPGRFWELGVGVVLALRTTSDTLTLRQQQGAALLGIGGIALAAATFGPQTPFPGAAALVPVFSTVLLLLSPASGMARALSARPLVFIGDLSYGWYLWHWPFIVLARTVWPESSVAAAAAGLLAIAPAMVSKAALEDRLRRNDAIVGWRAAVLVAVCTAGPAGCALVVSFGAATAWGLTKPEGWRESRLAMTAGCVDSPEPFDESKCLFSAAGASKTALLIGDSHAASISDGARVAAHGAGFNLAISAMSGCPALSGRWPLSAPECRARQELWLELVEQLRPEAVIVANRSSAYTLPTVPRGAASKTIGGPRGEAPADRAEALAFWREGVVALAEELQRRGASVVWLSVVPEFSEPFANRVTLLRPHVTPPAVLRSWVEERRGDVVAIERMALAGRAGVTVVDPVAVLCDAQHCASADEEWRYMDDHHLTPYGSKLLVPDLRAAIGGAPQPTP